MDKSPTWNTHVEYLSGNVRNARGILSRKRKNTMIHTASTFYKLFIAWNCFGMVIK